MELTKSTKKLITTCLLLTLSFGIFTSGCAKEEKKYRTAEVYLDCENYSVSQNDPGNCQVVPGTTSGLRVQEGMIVSEEYVEDIMKDLGWSKVNHTQKYTDVDGVSFRVEVYKYKRAIN